MQDYKIVEHPPERVRLGRILLASGVAGWIGSVGYLVATDKMNIPVMILALVSFATYFVGKSLLKTTTEKIED